MLNVPPLLHLGSFGDCLGESCSSFPPDASFEALLAEAVGGAGAVLGCIYVSVLFCSDAPGLGSIVGGLLFAAAESSGLAGWRGLPFVLPGVGTSLRAVALKLSDLPGALGSRSSEGRESSSSEPRDDEMLSLPLLESKAAADEPSCELVLFDAASFLVFGASCSLNSSKDAWSFELPGEDRSDDLTWSPCDDFENLRLSVLLSRSEDC
jgi:hypothetical protein